MNIQPLNYEFAHRRRLKSGYDSAHPDSSVRDCAEKCENKNRGYSAIYSGKSRTERSETAAISFNGHVMDTKAFHWLTGFAGAHNVAAAALVGLFLAGGLRPAITISLPGKKDMEDKIFAAGHSLASAIIGFAFSTLITTPIDSGIKFIMKDAGKMRKEDYDNLTVKELAEYIRKDNITPERIAEKMKSDTLSEKEILKQLLNEEGKALKPEELAQYVKDNNGQILPTRHPKNKLLTIVSSKVDEINALRHKLSASVDMVEKGKLLGQIRELENHIGGIEKTMHNITEWGIAIPRAMLTIALIPPILKYIFHVEKKKTEAPKTEQKQEIKNEAPKTEQKPEVQQSSSKTASTEPVKSLKDFVGGNK